MVLRKPYALFIKYFRTMHALLAMAIIYLTYRTGFVLNFLNEAILDPTFNLRGSVNITLMDFSFQLIPFLVVLLSGLILAVLVYKEKPFKFYIINIISFLTILFFNFYLANYLYEMETTIMTAQSLSLMRDFVLIAIIVEILLTIKFVITGIGFDIKSFDFGKDLDELDVQEIDREEFEVDFQVDFNKYHRKFLAFIRNFRYYYFENMFKANVLIAVLIVFFSTLVFTAISRQTSGNYEEGMFFTGNNVTMGVINSYITNQNFRNQPLGDEGLLLIVEIEAASRFGRRVILDEGRMRLEIGNFSFYNEKKHRDALADIGITYERQEIRSDFAKYLLVFEIPNHFKGRSMNFKYVDDLNYVGHRHGSGIKVFELNPQILDKNLDTYHANLGEKIYFREPILHTEMKIVNFQIADEFKLTYNYCYRGNNCFTSVEYIRPGYSSNVPQALLALEGEIIWDEKITHLNLDLFGFLNKFAVLRYKIDDKTKAIILNRQVIPNRIKNDGKYYIEVPKEMLDANEIELVLQLRNYTYRYVLK